MGQGGGGTLLLHLLATDGFGGWCGLQLLDLSSSFFSVMV